MSGKLTRVLTKVPGLTSPPSYTYFFKKALEAKENRKAIVEHGKSAIDAEYEGLLRSSMDENRVAELMKEVTSTTTICSLLILTDID